LRNIRKVFILYAFFILHNFYFYLFSSMLNFIDLKNNPNSYDKIDDYFNGKKEVGNKFNKGRRGKESDFKFKNNKSSKKPQSKRPGKITRMNNRNKKFSKKSR